MPIFPWDYSPAGQTLSSTISGLIFEAVAPKEIAKRERRKQVRAHTATNLTLPAPVRKMTVCFLSTAPER